MGGAEPFPPYHIIGRIRRTIEIEISRRSHWRSKVISKVDHHLVERDDRHLRRVEPLDQLIEVAHRVASARAVGSKR